MHTRYAPEVPAVAAAVAAAAYGLVQPPRQCPHLVVELGNGQGPPNLSVRALAEWIEVAAQGTFEDVRLLGNDR